MQPLHKPKRDPQTGMITLPGHPSLGQVVREGRWWVPYSPTGDRGIPRSFRDAFDYVIQGFKNREVQRLHREIYRMLQVSPSRPYAERTVYIIGGTIQGELKAMLAQHPQGAHELEHPANGHWIPALTQAASKNTRFLIVDGAGLNYDEIDNMLRACRGFRADYPGGLCIFLPEYPRWVQNIEQETYNRRLNVEI